MEVWVSRDERYQRETRPFAAAIRKCDESNQQWHGPEFAEEDMERTLVEVVATIRQRQHGYYLKYG